MILPRKFIEREEQNTQDSRETTFKEQGEKTPGDQTRLVAEESQDYNGRREKVFKEGREVSAISSVRARNEVKIKWPLNLAIQKP